MLKPESTMEKQKPLLRKRRKLPENMLHVNTQCTKGVCKATSSSGPRSFNSEEKQDAGRGILSTSELPCVQQSKTYCIRSKCDKSFSGHAQLLAHQEVRPRKTSDLYALEGMHAEGELCEDGEIEQHSPHVTPRSAQSEAEQYTCTECDKQFDQSSDLAIHQQVHTVERPYGFNELEEGVSSTGELTIPFQNSTEDKTYVCEKCGKGFWQEFNFKKHQRLHGRTELYDCNKCEKQFCFLSGLQAHHQIHNAGYRSIGKYKVRSSTRIAKSIEPYNTRSRKADQKMLKPESTMEKQRKLSENILHALGVSTQRMKGVCNTTSTSGSPNINFEERPDAGGGILSTSEIPCKQQSETDCIRSKCDKSFSGHAQLIAHQEVNPRKTSDLYTLEGMDAERLLCVDGEIEQHSPHVTPQSAQSEADQYTCTECGKQFSQSSDLASHQQVHLVEGPYGFNELEEGVSSTGELTIPFQNSTEDKTYDCNKCGKQFCFLSGVQAHHQIYNTSKMYMCAACEKCFDAAHLLTTHQAILSKEENLTNLVMPTPEETLYLCADCGESFNDWELLVAHSATHTSQKEDCGKQTDLDINHMEMAHTCTECGMNFNDPFTLSRHQQQHKQDKELMCNYCDKRFDNLLLMMAHEQKHLKNRQYVCTECGYVLRTSSSLRAHLQMHIMEKLYTCIECGKGFRNAHLLSTHQLTHVGENPYLCGDCGECFPDPASFISHHKSHTTRTPYSCKECGKRYTKKSGLDFHLLTHTKEKKQSNLNTSTVNGEPCIDLTDQYSCAEAENQTNVKALFIIKKETHMNSTNHKIHLKEENQRKVNSVFIKEEPCLVSDQPHSHIKEENQTNLNTLIEKKEFDSDSVNQHIQAKEGKQKTLNTLIINEEPYLDLPPKNGIINWASLTVLQQTRVAQQTFPCDKCTAIFTCSADLSMHQTEHSQEPEFVCFECGQCMSSSYQLSKHQQMHKQEKLHECTECSMSFNTSTLLSRHQQKHEVGRLYTCTECGQAFRTASYLYRHKQKHLRDNILEEFYECPTCNQVFRNSRLLETHQLTHAGENPFLCSDCGESFKDPASFITHHKTHTQVNKTHTQVNKTHTQVNKTHTPVNKTHTQVKPYVCSECGRRYRTNTLLTVHQLMHLPGY